MWKSFKCRLFGEHDYLMRREPRTLFLECRRCGHRSSGWTLSANHVKQVKRPDTRLRLFIAEPGDAGRAVRAVNGIGVHVGAMSKDPGTLRLTFARDS